MAKKTHIYRDFSLNFASNPFNSDVSTVSDEKSIAQSVKNIVLTDPGEIPFTPMLGGGIRSALFDNPSIFTLEIIKEKIKLSVQNYEPRVELEDVIVEYDSNGNAYIITIQFTSYLSEDISQISFTLERIL